MGEIYSGQRLRGAIRLKGRGEPSMAVDFTGDAPRLTGAETFAEYADTEHD